MWLKKTLVLAVVCSVSVLGEELLRRSKRAASAFTAAQKKIILDEHIKFRKAAGAMNMAKMEWHDKLAESAQGLADRCEYKHIFVPVTGLEYTEETYGQNNYFHSAELEVEKIVASWHSEIGYYNYDTMKCEAGKMCGHYTQIVWHNSRHIGCGFKQCASLFALGQTFKNAYMAVCNYGPGGNFGGQKPFAKGKSCARCDNGVGWCTPDGFCDQSCTAASANCVCKMLCARGFPNDAATCKCKCGDGYKGKFCLEECVDTGKQCGDYSTPECDAALSGPDTSKYLKKECHALCGPCVKLTDANKKDDSTDLTAPSGGGTESGGTTGGGGGDKITTTTTTTTTKKPPTVITTTKKPPATPKPTPPKTKPTEDSSEELTIGIVMDMQADIKDWTVVWQNLQKLISDALNFYCNGEPDKCCGGAKKQATQNLVFMSHSDVQHGERYPIQKTGGVLEILIFAKSDNSPGCNAVKSTSKRRKRSTDSGVKIPKEVLLNAVQKEMATIETKMKACCNVTVKEVKAAPEPTTTKPTETKPTEDSPEELTIGIVMDMQADINDWTKVWKNLRALISDALNLYCNGEPNKCCGGEKKKATQNLVFMSHSDVQHGERYPIQKTGGVLEILIFAKSDNSAGCNAVKSKSKRRKRSTDSGVKIPKEVLLNAVQKEMKTIETKMKACCNVVVKEVKAAPEPSAFDCLEGWEIALIVISLLAVLVVIAILLALLDRQMDIKRLERQELKKHGPESKVEGVDNPQVKNDSAM